MSIKKVVIGIAILAFGLLAIFLSNEWNRAAWGSEGYIENGTKFGLTIGESKPEVAIYLTSRGLINETTVGINETHYNPQSCYNYIHGAEYEVELWRDDSWRRGSICIAFLDGKLARVSWWYGMFQP